MVTAERAVSVKAFMSTGKSEGERFATRGIEPTRACWALDEASRILAHVEPPREAATGIYPGNVDVLPWGGEMRRRAHVELAESLTAFCQMGGF